MNLNPMNKYLHTFSFIILLISITFMFSYSDNKRIYKKYVYSFKLSSNDNLFRDSVLVKIVTFNKEGLKESENYIESNITNYYFYDESKKIIKIQRRDENNILISESLAITDNDGKIIYIKMYNPITCENRRVTCYYNENGNKVRKIVYENSTKKRKNIIHMESYSYEFY